VEGQGSREVRISRRVIRGGEPRTEKHTTPIHPILPIRVLTLAAHHQRRHDGAQLSTTLR